jgi:hypothetical protein
MAKMNYIYCRDFTIIICKTGKSVSGPSMQSVEDDTNKNTQDARGHCGLKF